QPQLVVRYFGAPRTAMILIMGAGSSPVLQRSVARSISRLFKPTAAERLFDRLDRPFWGRISTPASCSLFWSTEDCYGPNNGGRKQSCASEERCQINFPTFQPYRCGTPT